MQKKIFYIFIFALNTWPLLKYFLPTVVKTIVRAKQMKWIVRKYSLTDVTNA